jgi:hypothetical protein
LHRSKRWQKNLATRAVRKLGLDRLRDNKPKPSITDYMREKAAQKAKTTGAPA